MRKIIVSAGMVLLLTAAMTSLVFANAPVSFTWAASDLGGGCHGGGPLYADGTAGGGAFCSLVLFNGQVLAQLQPVNWTGPVGGFVTISFNVIPMKGTLPFPVSPLPLPVTGTPIKVISAPGVLTLIRVTPVQ